METAERKTIYLDDAIEAIRKLPNAGIHWFVSAEAVFDALLKLPSAELDMAENLYPYKCYITDEDGLQHEVIHTGDIRRVTGWEI